MLVYHKPEQNDANFISFLLLSPWALLRKSLRPGSAWGESASAVLGLTHTVIILEQVLPLAQPFNLQQPEFALGLPVNLDKFPDGWTDPLELYGDRLPELKSYGCNMDTERISLKELIEKYGPNWIWDNRHQLAKVAMCLKNYPRK